MTDVTDAEATRTQGMAKKGNMKGVSLGKAETVLVDQAKNPKFQKSGQNLVHCCYLVY